MMEITLRIKIPDNWVEDIASKYDTPIKFIDCMPFGKSGGRGLIEINAKDNEVDRIIEDLNRHDNICKVDISPSPDGGVLGSVITKKCVACQALTGSKCFLTSARSIKDGHVEWKLITGEKESLVELMDKLDKAGCSVELLKCTYLTKRAQLTLRQEEIIRVAFERGYYNVPKKITLNKLAKLFGVSLSTLAEILQRGERKIIMQYFNKTR